VIQRICAARFIDGDARDLGLELFAEGGSVSVAALDVWELSPIG
jgi:hypothetical protein